VDGRSHYVVLSDLELTGAIVDARSYKDGLGRNRLSLATRSDLTGRGAGNGVGATWLDRQLLAKDSAGGAAGFGAEIREAMDRRIDRLIEQDLARRQGQRIIFARDLLDTLRRRELDEVAAKLSAETDTYRPSAEGEHLSGVLPSACYAGVRPLRDD
jgi:hypothetical protein